MIYIKYKLTVPEFTVTDKMAFTDSDNIQQVVSLLEFEVVKKARECLPVNKLTWEIIHIEKGGAK